MNENATESNVGCSTISMLQKEKGDSLMSLVYDKNRTIEKLQKQLHFQKLQLKYYLNKTFSKAEIVNLSKTCCPSKSDDSLPLAIAMSRFYKGMGIKNKILTLYGRMYGIDEKTRSLLSIQEYILKRMVKKICKTSKKSSKVELLLHDSVPDNEQMEIFNKLLSSNIELRKYLDVFRICCDRLIFIEEERNSIVEQVYSTPIEQRTNCNFLISNQIEKVQLQNQMKCILKEHFLLRKKMSELNGLGLQLKKMQEEYEISYRSIITHVTDMLRKMNSEALSLVSATNYQREKYTKEIVKLKNDNLSILKVLEGVKSSINEEGTDLKAVELNIVYSAELFRALEKEITEVLRDKEMKQESALDELRVRSKNLESNLREAHGRNLFLLKQIELMKVEYDEDKNQWIHKLGSTEQEKRQLKAQIEDLEAIRTAYAQLTQNRRNGKSDEDLSENDKNEQTLCACMGCEE